MKHRLVLVLVLAVTLVLALALVCLGLFGLIPSVLHPSPLSL